MDIRDTARAILQNAGCSESDYQGIDKETIMKDLRLAFPDGIQGGFSFEEMADTIYSISTTERGWKEPIVYQYEGIYASHCGVTDLYKRAKEDLNQLLLSGEPFETKGLASKKELASWSMSRELVDGPISITMKCWMDEGPELVDDALPDGVELSDEQIDEILDIYITCYEGIYHAEETSVIAGTSTLDDVLEKVSELYDSANQALDSWFQIMREIVQDYTGQNMSGIKPL